MKCILWRGIDSYCFRTNQPQPVLAGNPSQAHVTLSQITTTFFELWMNRKIGKDSYHERTFLPLASFRPKVGKTCRKCRRLCHKASAALLAFKILIWPCRYSAILYSSLLYTALLYSTSTSAATTFTVKHLVFPAPVGPPSSYELKTW